LEKQALTLAPADPRTAYNVACGEAIAGHPMESILMLDQLVARGLDFGADKDTDFTNISQSPEWRLFKDRLASLRKPVVRSSTAFTLPDKGLIATSIAVDEQSGDAYIGSGRERKIVKRTKDGVISDFATEKDGLLAVSYLVIDPIRKQLIASTAAVAFMQGFQKEDEGKSGICIFDLATGKLLRKVFLTGEGGHHLLNAMVVDQSGNVFVVDSGSAEIYRLRRASSELELYVSSVVFPAPQGLALSVDERTLYVADFVDGIWAVEVLSTDRRHIDSSPEIYMPGLDGITRVKDGFIGVQIGLQPIRVVHIRLDSKGERIASMETLESNHPEFGGPTQGTLSGGDFLYIANSQIALANAKTGIFVDEHARPTTILRLPLGK
jgi:sugar lactone lactonase YvrE